MARPFGPSGGGSSAPTSGDDLSRAQELLQTSREIIQNMGWTGLGQSLLGTMALIVGLGFGDLFNAVLNVPITLLQTLASLVPALNEATFGGIANFIGAGIAAGAGAFGSGWVGLLGIFQGPVGIGVGLIMLWELAWYLDYTDRDFLGFAMDIPDFILNNDDSGVAEGAEDE